MITWVHDGGASSTTTGPLTFPLSVTAGNEIVVGITSNTPGASTVTDTVGTVYTRKQISPIGSPAVGNVELWTGKAAGTSASNDVVVTFPVTLGAPIHIASAFQYSGVVGEGQVVVYAQSVVPTTQTAVGPSITTVAPGDWIVAVEGYSNVGGNGAASAGGSFPTFVTGGNLVNDTSGQDGRQPFGALSGLAFISGLCDNGPYPVAKAWDATIDPDVPGVGTESTTSIYLELKA